MSNEDIKAIHEELETDRVFVHPSMADQFTDAQLTLIEREAAEHDAWVVVWPFDRNDEYGGSPDDLLVRLHDSYPVDGTYLSTTELPYRDQLPDLAARAWGADAPDEYLLSDVMWAVNYPEPATLGDAYLRAFEVLDLSPGKIEKLANRALEQRSAASDAEYGDSSGEEGGLDVPPWVWPVVLLPVLAAVGWRLATRRKPAPQATLLPPSALARIREAHDRTLHAQAREDLLRLGEAVDAAELTPSGDAAAWQAALDHYDAGQRLMDAAQPEVLDMIGAIVLSRRGQAALASALAGRAWTPVAPCFLNPLHGEATRKRHVRSLGSTVQAPLCSACDTALDRNQVPDILDVARGSQPLHYFDTDAEPWASTGFGSLHLDLIERLHARG